MSRVVRQLCRLTIGALLLGCSRRDAPDVPPSLLHTLGDSASLAPSVARDSTVMRRRFVTVDSTALESRGFRLTVALFADTVMLELDSVSVDTAGVTWFGRVANELGSSALLVYQNGSLYGVIRRGGDATYEVRSVRDRVHVLEERRASRYPPEEAGETTLSLGADADDPMTAVCATDPADSIDVLVAYTSDVRSALGGKQGVDAFIRAAFASANDAYRRSGISLRVRPAGQLEASYAESGTIATDRDRLRAKTDGELDDVHHLRDASGADIVALITETGGESCGAAYVMSSVSAAFADHAFAAIVRKCAVGNFSFVHELGHVMGARHDVATDATDGKPYAYNHGYIRPAPTTAVAPWRTIMAYDNGCKAEGVSCRRIGYFSNPDKTYPESRGDPLGTARADNRRTLNNTAKVVASFRCRMP